MNRKWILLLIALVAVLGWNSYLHRKNARNAAKLWAAATDDVVTPY